MQNSLPAFCGNVVVMPLHFAMIGHGSAILLRGKGGEVVKEKATTPKRLPGEASLGSDSFLPEQAGRKF